MNKDFLYDVENLWKHIIHLILCLYFNTNLWIFEKIISLLLFSHTTSFLGKEKCRPPTYFLNSAWNLRENSISRKNATITSYINALMHIFFVKWTFKTYPPRLNTQCVQQINLRVQEQQRCLITGWWSLHLETGDPVIFFSFFALKVN